MIAIIVVNLFGVPSAGKSTGAAYIFAQLKMHGINAELVTEFAKDKVWENNEEVFKNQAYVFGKQSFKMSRCRDKVDVIITDSPLPLSIFYNNSEILTENFNLTVMDVFNSYNNMNYLLLRTKPYNPIGRLQTEKESDALKQPMIDLLRSRNILYIEKNGDTEGYDQIVEDVLDVLAKVKRRMEMKQQTQEIPQSVINHIGRKECDKIKFLEIFLGIKFKWYQKIYLQMFFNKDIEIFYNKALKIKEAFYENDNQR